MRIIPVLLLFLLTSCYSSYYRTDSSPRYHLQLQPTGKLAQLIYDGAGLSDHIVIGYDSVRHYAAEPDFLSFYAQNFGAQKVMWLSVDTVAEFYIWKRSCDTCDWYRKFIGRVNSSNKNIGEEWKARKKRHGDVDKHIYYMHHAVLLVHPDSLYPVDRVVAIELYDEDDDSLEATITFDWNEQIDTIIGDPYVAKRFLALQPIGFLKQRNTDWQSYFSQQTNVLRRKNQKTGIRYKIKPDKNSTESFEVFLNGEVFTRLHTVYYGNHDWTVGSSYRDNPYQVDYRFDRQGRMGYMHIKNEVFGGRFENHVRIYYRPSQNVFPENWSWGQFLLARYQP
jgi:hypothetical protein